MKLTSMLTILILACLGAQSALACSCMRPKESVIEILREGTIIAQGVAERVTGQPQGDALPRRHIYRFAVKKSLNRRLAADITLTTASSGAACGADLQSGSESIVVLYPSAEDGVYSFGLCGQLLVGANEEDWKTLFDAIPD